MPKWHAIRISQCTMVDVQITGVGVILIIYPWTTQMEMVQNNRLGESAKL